MKTVLFGGAFDPPHRGHERALRAVLDRVAPDRVVVLPSGRPPHKDLSSAVDGQGRMELCRAAFSPCGDRVVFSDYDLKQAGKCYTYLALEHFRAEDPEGELYLFVGTDQFLVFETWVRFREILENAVLCVMARDGDETVLTEKKEQLERDFSARVLLLREKAIIISSTEVRSEIGRRGFSDYLSPAVNEIIARKGYYGSRLTKLRGSFLDRIASYLDAERLTHTLAVERETVRLYELLGEACPEEMRLAALFHDLTRRSETEEQLWILAEADEPVSPDDLQSPVVLHGRSAAVIARTCGLSPAYCDAIRYHTTGRRDMTLPDKVLFFADFIEETRRHKVCRDLRARFYGGLPEGADRRLSWLDACILDALKGTVEHLKETGRPVHPLSLEALKDMTEKLKNRKETT